MDIKDWVYRLAEDYDGGLSFARDCTFHYFCANTGGDSY